jgi:tetratricopeptide (TPR) repeat protein
MSTVAGLAALLWGVVAHAATAEKLGTVSFPVSCAPAVQADFNRGVALLHDFWYEEARPQFQRILQTDPGCAMAHWGLAMSSFHQIWDQADAATLTSGWREMQAAQAHPAPTAREGEYLAALAVFYNPGQRDYQARIEAYSAAMGRLHAHYPKDVDAGAFYALSLLAAQPPHDTSLAAEHQAMAVLTPLWRQYPDHPGLVHYIIHSCDTPSLAADGLSAARHYGVIAASGPHAVHMPGHIFARLGLWQDDIDVNSASVAASEAAEARGESGWMDQFHSDDFLVYAYLQSGQEDKARETVAASQAAIAHYESMPGMSSDNYMVGMFPYYRVKLPVFVALETHDWPAALRIEPLQNSPPEHKILVSWAHVIGAARLHQAKDAHASLATYDDLVAAVKKGPRAYLVESTSQHILRGEMAAWVAFADGNLPEAERQMRIAADLQDRVGQGEVDIPAREMLADILLEAGQPQQALVEYRQSLQLSPNRFNTLYNAGKAAEAAGDAEVARGYYAALLKATHDGAHSKRPELAHAKSFVSDLKVGSRS